MEGLRNECEAKLARLREEHEVALAATTQNGSTEGISCSGPLAVEYESVGVIGNAFCSRSLYILSVVQST